MILTITVSVLLILLVIPFLARVGLTFLWTKSGTKVQLRYFKFGYSPDFGTKEGNAEQGEEQPGPEDKSGKSFNLEESISWIKLAGKSLDAIRRMLNLLNRYGRVSQIYLVGSYGFDDPYRTGVACGAISAVRDVVGAVLPQARLELKPDFTRSGVRLRGGAGLDIRLGYLVLILLVTLWYLPKQKTWQLIRSS